MVTSPIQSLGNLIGSTFNLFLESHPFPSYFFYLTAPSLSCSTQDLLPWPGLKPWSPALGAWSLNHWTTRKVPHSPQFCHHHSLCPFTSHLDAYGKKNVKVKLLSHAQLFMTPMDCGLPGSSSMGFSRQEYWSGLPFPSPGDLPDPGIEPGSPSLQADSLPSEPPGNPLNDYDHLLIVFS